MVSANIPEQWLAKATILRLSDRAYRHHCVLLTWSVSNRTNGHVPGDIPLLQTGITDEGLRELADAGLLEVRGDGWTLTQYDATQSSAEQISASLENLRSSARDRKRKSRARQKDAGESTDGHVTVAGPAESRAEQSRAEQLKAAGDEGSSGKTDSTRDHPFESGDGKVYDSDPAPSWAVASIPSDGDVDQVDTATGEVFQEPTWCETFACDRDPLPGLNKCSAHAGSREDVEAQKAEARTQLLEERWAS